MFEIFVCDDDVNITEFLKFFIMKHFGDSYKVFTMNRCQELIGMVEIDERVPDILIMDINLKDGDGISILLSDLNRRAIGICTVAMSFAYIIEGLSKLLGGLQEGIPIASVVILISGFLLLFAGIVIIAQKDVKFGGSLCVTAVAIEWIFNIYQLINSSFNVKLWHIFLGIAAVTACIWAYGYKTEEKITGIGKVLHIITYALSGIIAILTIVFIAASLTMIL